jgi:uncharacterized protein
LVTRRKFLQTSAVVAATGAMALTADATLFEATRPQLVQLEIPIARLPVALDGLTIAQLSDFHYDDLFGVIPIRKAVEIVNRLQPQLVVLTGDFVTISVLSDYLHNAKQAASAAEPCARLLSQLHAPLGVFATLGNHDTDSDPSRITDALQAEGIVVLRNRSVPLELEARRLWLAGIDDALVGKPDLEAALRGIPREEPVILLAHEPDFADQAVRYPVDLQLSGHSHGGQLRFPLVGAPYLPELARKYPRGLMQVGPLTLYTNIGLGTIRIPARLNCPPEVTLFTLRSASRNR